MNIDDFVIHIKKSKDGLTHNQVVFKFPNGYGASLIQGDYTYGGDQGLFEIAVLIFTPDNEWEICYNTPITDDTLGYLTENEVLDTLQSIYNLKPLLEE